MGSLRGCNEGWRNWKSCVDDRCSVFHALSAVKLSHVASVGPSTSSRGILVAFLSSKRAKVEAVWMIGRLSFRGQSAESGI